MVRAGDPEGRGSLTVGKPCRANPATFGQTVRRRPPRAAIAAHADAHRRHLLSGLPPWLLRRTAAASLGALWRPVARPDGRVLRDGRLLLAPPDRARAPGARVRRQLRPAPGTLGAGARASRSTREVQGGQT